MGPVDGMRTTPANSTRLDPIEATWKISDVIGRYPHLVDELAGLHPSFRLLRNPLARRVQSRLVTVAQAAQIANLRPEQLVSTLNAAIGIVPAEISSDIEDSSTAIDGGTPAWVEEPHIVAEVDARLLQRENKEPFGAIMAAVRQVGRGEALRIRSSFEPVPLYGVLAQRGFEHFTRQAGADDWEILFGNSGRILDRVVVAPAAHAIVDDVRLEDSPTATITIDVSELVPPEPLVRIMEALEALPAGASLLVHHVAAAGSSLSTTRRIWLSTPDDRGRSR